MLIFFPLGQIIFDHYLRNDIKTASIVMVIVGIIYICLPLNSIIDFFNKENFYLEEKQYKDVKDTFKDNYVDLHPMYSKLNPEQNSESRRLYKDHVMKQLSNPVFSFVNGWLVNKGEQINAFGKNLSNLRTTRDESNIEPNSSSYQTKNENLAKKMHNQFA